jgi:hypothetical protein
MLNEFSMYILTKQNLNKISKEKKAKRKKETQGKRMDKQCLPTEILQVSNVPTILKKIRSGVAQNDLYTVKVEQYFN